MLNIYLKLNEFILLNLSDLKNVIRNKLSNHTKRQTWPIMFPCQCRKARKSCNYGTFSRSNEKKFHPRKITRKNIIRSEKNLLQSLRMNHGSSCLAVKFCYSFERAFSRLLIISEMKAIFVQLILNQQSHGWMVEMFSHRLTSLGRETIINQWYKQIIKTYFPCQSSGKM